MRKRLLFGTGTILLVILVVLIVWQTSFTFGDFAPQSPVQTLIFWGVSTLIFVLTIALGFMLVRTGLKLYVERQRNREGSRIRTRLVLGALALSFLPVIFLVLFGMSVLNRSVQAWFSRPGNNIKWTLINVGVALDNEAQSRARLLAAWLPLHAEAPDFPGWEKACAAHGVEQAWREDSEGRRSFVCGPNASGTPKSVEGRSQTGKDQFVIRLVMPLDLAEKKREIDQEVAAYDELFYTKNEFRRLYIQLLALIGLFVLFVATWIARFLAQQISDPISAILEAAHEVRKGNLAHRIETRALDELGTLVRAFNQMTEDLESNSRELDRRRRFTEAILESIPSGVISLAPDGRIKRVYPGVTKIFPHVSPLRLELLSDLLPREEAKEIEYLMKRASRTGIASRQLDFRLNRRPVHLAVTVAALDEKENAGYVLVMEDATELLRVQKAEAWHEVARRVAHEIKNPLTPIALCAERVVRQLDRAKIPPESSRILRQCCETILTEVESVKALVNEFSQYARFPAAQLAPGDVNEAIENALSVFHGRLTGIEIHKDLAAGLPPVNMDREQFKRVVINLVDNAAEAMQESLVRRLTIRTHAPTPEAVELLVADTGCGVSEEDRDKLFLPYFSTKGRGTGLGLAIVSHILTDHQATIRVEDNKPAGTKFIVEIPAIASSDVETHAVEARA